MNNKQIIITNQNSKLPLQKSKNISRSNWENEELTSGQVKYASEDATVVYDVMNKILEQYPFVMNLMPMFFQAQYSQE